jgi:hypothetical protein
MPKFVNTLALFGKLEQEEAPRPKSMTKAPKISPTKAWELAHPDDAPCPRMPHVAAAWRRKRGILSLAEVKAKEEGANHT